MKEIKFLEVKLQTWSTTYDTAKPYGPSDASRVMYF